MEQTPLDLNDLARFVAIADAGGVSAAAARLGLPKSSLSRALARLEHALDVQLLRRTTRKVALTSSGAALRERAGPLLVELARAAEALPERAPEPSGRLRVTVPVDFGAVVLAEIVARFAERHPQIEVEVCATSAFVDLVRDGFDVAVRITRGRLRDSALVARSVGAVALRLYASPRYLARHGAPRGPEDLAAHAFVAGPGQRSFELRAGDAEVRVAPRARVRADDMLFARAAARAGAGIALVPAFLGEPDVASGELARVLARWTAPSGRVWLVHASGGRVPAKIAAFSAFVTEALAGLT